MTASIEPMQIGVQRGDFVVWKVRNECKAELPTAEVMFTGGNPLNKDCVRRTVPVSTNDFELIGCFVTAKYDKGKSENNRYKYSMSPTLSISASSTPSMMKDERPLEIEILP